MTKSIAFLIGLMFKYHSDSITVN